MRYLSGVLVCLAMGVTACGGSGSDDPIACTPNIEFGVFVQVVDATTVAPVSGATLTLREGTYSEVMQETAAGDYVGAAERAGTYDLTVEAAGYVTATRADIVVTADACHVETVTLMVPLSTP